MVAPFFPVLSGAFSSLFNEGMQNTQAELTKNINAYNAQLQGQLQRESGKNQRESARALGQSLAFQGGQSPVPSVSSSSLGLPSIDLNSISSILNSIASVKSADANQTTAEANKQNANTNENVGNATIEQLLAQARSFETSADYTEKQIEWYDSLKENEVELLKSQARKNDNDITIALEKLPAELDLLQKQGILYTAETSLRYAERKKVLEQIDEIKYNIRRLDSEITKNYNDAYYKEVLTEYQREAIRIAQAEGDMQKALADSYNSINPKARYIIDQAHAFVDDLSNVVSSICLVKANFAPATKNVNTKNNSTINSTSSTLNRNYNHNIPHSTNPTPIH